MSFIDRILAARRAGNNQPLFGNITTGPINPNPNVNTISDGGYGANTTNTLLGGTPSVTHNFGTRLPNANVGLMGDSRISRIAKALKKDFTTPPGFEEAGEQVLEPTDMYNLYKFPETIQNNAKNWDTSVVDNRAIRKIVSEDPIIGAIIQAESSGGHNLKSPKGARGVMQLMPNTYGRTLNEKESEKESIKQGKEVKVYNYAHGMYGKWLDENQVMDAEQNVKFGAEYYNKLKQDENIGNGSDRQALIAYNWGPGNYKKWKAAGGKESELPQETRDYLKKIEDIMKRGELR